VSEALGGSAEAAARAPAAPWRELGYVAIAAAVFATSGPIAKVIETVHPIGVACGRTGLAALGLLLLDGRAIVGAWRAAPLREWGRALLAGVLLAAHFGAYLGGLAATSLAAASALVSIEPIAVLAVAALVHGLHPRRAEIVGVALATLGAFVVGSAAGHGEHRLAGDLLVVASVFLYGFYVAAARGVSPAIPSRAYAAFVYGAASLVLVPVIALLPEAQRRPSPGDSLRVLALAVFPTLIGHTLIQRGASRVRPAVLALVSPGETIGAIAIGACMLQMPPSGREWAGIVVVLAGTTLAAAASRGR
jgi:drug/metabolite transporter (DMT)-like permease